MSRRFFTSDFHFGSTLINRFAGRPFVSAEDALTKILVNVNFRLSRTDLLLHVGDFCLHGKDGHAGDVDIGLDHSKDDYLAMLDCRTLLLAGNHDENNSCEPDVKNTVIDLNQKWRNVYVNHFPSNHKFYRGLVGNSWKTQVNLCGHVHQAWLFLYDANRNVLNYNVGVDVHGYAPVEDVEITADLDLFFEMKTRFRGKISDVLSRSDFDRLVSEYKKQLKSDRVVRKAERYERKGLTPEECERRRIAAMKAKGLA